MLLSVQDGNLTLQDSKTVFAVLDPMKLLGPSAFGPLKFRPVGTDGVEGDWQPLVNLVRTPELKGIRCASGPAKPKDQTSAGKTAAGSEIPQKECTLIGEKLFLIDAVSVDPDFANPVTVPDGFVERSLTVPEPKSQTLYLKLRDDPATVSTALLPALNSQE